MTTRYKFPVCLSAYRLSTGRVTVDEAGWFVPASPEEEQAMIDEGFVPEVTEPTSEQGPIPMDAVTNLVPTLQALNTGVDDVAKAIVRAEANAEKSITQVLAYGEDLAKVKTTVDGTVDALKSTQASLDQVKNTAQAAANTVATVSSSLGFQTSNLTALGGRVSALEATVKNLPSGGVALPAGFSYKGAWPVPNPSEATRGRMALVQGVADSDLVFVDRGTRWTPLTGEAILGEVISGFYTVAAGATTVLHYRDFPAGIVSVNSELRLELALSSAEASTKNFIIGVSSKAAAVGTGVNVCQYSYPAVSPVSFLTLRILNRGSGRVRVLCEELRSVADYSNVDFSQPFRVYVSLALGQAVSATPARGGLESITYRLISGV